MTRTRIAILGGGNLGAAIAEGLLKSKFIEPGQLIVTRRNVGALASLEAQGVCVTSDNRQAVRDSEVVIVALKPYNVREVGVGDLPLSCRRHA
jgi:pyrroline-5-carboxylate reductase